MPALALLLAGCGGPQSALDVAGREAEAVASLFWIMLAGAAVIWTLVIGTAVYALRFRKGSHDPRVARWFLLGGGVAFPVIVLTGLLVHGLLLMKDLRPAETQLTLAVTGEQWWWRVRYETPGGQAVSSANEIRLPAGRAAELILDSPDVIHSFWVPPLGGKMDMIPGRTTRLVLEPERPGRYRGACAEYCGASHALMAFTVEVMAPAAFDDWLAAEARPAAAPNGEAARRGADLFVDVGCGACHAVRGTVAAGTIGPDLTHLAGRPTLAAGTLPMTEDALARWIADPQAVKPGALMPPFAALGEARIADLAAYLAGLR
ncbi:MAG: cytochrome c oxidase subunit II [Bacteroidota bacterium]|nr:cytochrome c oxidase subunit II [Kiloniellaceae bacterium]